jgi:Heparinase II/III-like protein
MVSAVRTFLFHLVLLATASTPATAFASRAQHDSYPAAGDTLYVESDLFETRVYYERYVRRYMRESDVAILQSGRVRVQHYDPVETSNFRWERADTDYTWWMQMQELRFLLPLIASPSRGDRELAKSWLTRWYGVHVTGRVPAVNQGQPMTFAYRAMVFVYYLKTELRRRHPDPEVVAMLRTSILVHQRHLIPDSHFDANNNHGMIDALGLLETTRVFPDPAARSLALRRIRDLVERSVSGSGVHIEHSPMYHFAFLRWLDEILAYARDLSGVPPVFLTEMESASRRMRTAGYFLQDHRGNLPGIGDTDSVSVDYYGREYRILQAPDNAVALYDSAAGYAVFKGRDSRRDARYVVFRQPSRLLMRYHAHSDALAVFVAWDGEVLLGDAGRFTYEVNPERRYFRSQLAHSTILPPRKLGKYTGAQQPVVHSPRDLTSSSGTEWTADMDLPPGKVTRTVRVPTGGRDVVVDDAIFVDASADSTVREATVLWQVGRDIKDIERIEADTTGADGAWLWNLTTRRGVHARFEIVIRGDAPPDMVEVRVVRGQESPLIGWYAPRQHVKRPVSSIAVTLRTRSGAYVESHLHVLRR